MRLFNKVAIVGVGLIGGSIALVLKKKHLAQEVIGVARHKKTILLAKKNGAIDKGSQDINIIKDSDLVILATPVKTILNLAPKLSRIIKKDCIVTDVGSAKQEIVSGLENILPNYIGSHPLAGSEKRGITSAHPDIFKNSLCILTPTKNTSIFALNKIKILWNRMGATTVLLTPKMHDKILSFTSHLPHLAAFALVSIVPKKYMSFASTGLRDTTRIAASDSQLWRDIFLSNSQNLVKGIDLLQEELSKIKSAIKRKDAKQLFKILRQAKIRRDRLTSA